MKATTILNAATRTTSTPEYNSRIRRTACGYLFLYSATGELLAAISTPGEANHRDILDWGAWMADKSAAEYPEAASATIFWGEIGIGAVEVLHHEAEAASVENLCTVIEQMNVKSKWDKGVTAAALDILRDFDRVPTTRNELTAAILNGAKDWAQYSEGACTLIFDEDIAERFCTASEIKRLSNRSGLRGYLPNGENWMQLQARALKQAARRIARAAAILSCGYTLKFA